MFNSNENKKKESQYLLRVVYDTEDEKVHKLLEGIFGPDQMLDVKNGKVAKIHSSLTPKQRDYFLGMVSEAMEKAENDKELNETEEKSLHDNEEETLFDNEVETKKEQNESKNVKAEKLIKEFADFLNNI